MFPWFKKSPKDSHIEITAAKQSQIVDLLVHNAQVTFYLGVSITTLSTMVTLLIVILLLFNKIQSDRINVPLSILANLASFKLTQEAKRDLNDILKRSQVSKSSK
ncbi:MAG: hypothetical protein HEQ20_26265 [Aphanizomenon flos-aquae KM1D3_PB]|uniref:hypothetical protein n=1 Tax=Aphanizomenon flos-aquae TaxID=1176 RepID=UPI000541A582|nr:hypothetical protein [Aphanizomenon flos-aquae]KHG41939.1 hypothetical protein OA07_08230 [Aphanizomenon flos-aquae 2012/KM1/D3]QSV73636.1 MAG: hypothetical protein HEQ20_26265 [Aphanizomenon flos-aquae KM1D3_PB]